MIMMHGGGGGWWRYMHGGQNERSSLTWPLIRRVFGYARPYRARNALVFATILLTAALGLLPPLLLRDLIDNVLNNNLGGVERLNLLALGLVAVPVVSGALRVFQRRISAQVGEGIIYDLRAQLYAHLQGMSLRFYTHTQAGELMSRLNNDVIGAQRAITETFITFITNAITVVMTLAIMIALEWRLTLFGVLVLPCFILLARWVGGRLRTIVRQQMESNARMNALMNETLNINGQLLVKLFGQARPEVARFNARSAEVRDLGVRRAALGSAFFVVIGLLSAVGVALVYWLGGRMALAGIFSVGHHRRLRQLPHATVWAAASADQRAGRFRHVAGKLRARVRAAGFVAGDHRGAQRAAPGQCTRRAGIRGCQFRLRAAGRGSGRRIGPFAHATAGRRARGEDGERARGTLSWWAAAGGRCERNDGRERRCAARERH